MTSNRTHETLVFEDHRASAWFATLVMGGMGLAAAAGGPIYVLHEHDVLTGIVLVLVVGIPSLYAAWNYAQRGGLVTLTFDRRERSVTVAFRKRNRTTTAIYTFDDITSVRVYDSTIHGVPCYGVALVMSDGEHIPVMSSSLEHKDAQCGDIADTILAFIGRPTNRERTSESMR